MKKYKLIIGVVVVAVVIAAVALVNTQYQKGAFRLPRGAFRPRTEGIRQTTPSTYYRLTIANNAPSILRVVQIGEVSGRRIDCGGGETVCSRSYPEGTEVILGVSSVDSRYAFNGYTGDCTGVSCTLKMNSDKNVGVTYIPVYTLDIVTDSSILRVVDGRGMDCGTVCSRSYPEGTEVTLGVGLADGVDASRYAFTGYTGACTGDVCELTMDSAKTVGVTHREIPSYTLDIVTDSSILRVVDGRGMDCGTVCSRSYPEGTEVILGVSLADGVDASRYAFTGYTGACTGDVCELTMDSAKTVGVTHREIPSYTLDIVTDSSILRVVDGRGMDCGTVCSRSYPEGTEVILGVSLADDVDASRYAFRRYVSDYAGCTEGSCVLTMDSNKTVRVTHREIPIFATSVSPASPRGAVDAGLDQLIGAFVIHTPSNLTETVEVQSVSLTISQSEYLFQNMVLKDASGNILASVDFTPPPGAPTDSGSSEVRVFRINSDVFPLLDAEQQETTIYIYADIDDSACASPIEASLRLEIQPNGVSLFERSTNNWYYTPSSMIKLRQLYITCTGTGE